MGEREALATALAGRYEIEREIGRGGMATVYLARDSKHGRRVAVKVLNPELGAVLGVERFLGEIRVTANLQHPNLLPLFDSGEAAGLLYYVMPFVDGESLRARLDRERQLPVDEAVRIATAIASALGYAHANGVVHRDLKPENILIQAGQPVVADFGIALAVSKAGGERMTRSGITLGTPHYMSPEQASGDPLIDARSDVYALGAMTYEMLVGEPPHQGVTSQAIVARILTDRPRPVRQSRPSVPEHVEVAIERALEKLPADRFATANEFGDAVQGRGTAMHASRPAHGVRRASRIALMAAGMASLAAVLAGAGWWNAAHVPPPDPVRFAISPPRGEAFGAGTGRRVALSPDGRTLAFVTTSDSLFLLSVGAGRDATPFTKAAPAREIHFSPDGKALVYVQQGVNKVTLDDPDAAPVKLAEAETMVVAAWEHSNDVVYRLDNEFFRVPSSGGTPRSFARMDSAVDVLWIVPAMLPDGKAIAFSVYPRGSNASFLAVLPIDSGATRTLFGLEIKGVVGFVDDILIFVGPSGKLSAVKFDVRGRKPLGKPVELDESPGFAINAAVSDNGTLAYFETPERVRKIEIVEEGGRVVGEVPGLRTYVRPVWSPDRKSIAITITDGAKQDIWRYDVGDKTLRRLTRNGKSAAPEWTSDSKRIAFIQDGKALWMAADLRSAPEQIPGTAAIGAPLWDVSMSPNDRYALLGIAGEQPVGTPRWFAVPLVGGAPIPLLAGTENARNATVSPNGKWIAYSSRETGRHEIYVRGFPTGGEPVQVSTDMGEVPRWSPDGHQLTYLHEDQLRSATLDMTGAMPRVTRTDALGISVDGARVIPRYSPGPKGQFAVVRDTKGGDRLIVVLNWMTKVRAKLAER